MAVTAALTCRPVVTPDDVATPDEVAAAAYPGACAPIRNRRVDANGVSLAVHEWGDEDDPPLLLAHGGFDFARTFDVFAPMLAAGGWRVVAWDQRGHGDSQHSALYNWEADVRDAVAVMNSASDRPMPVVGHSKGGGVVVQLADACPHLVSHLINLDGLPSRHHQPDVADHERTRLRARELAEWLDHRGRASEAVRRPDTLAGLAARRARMNPRLSQEWLRYLVTAGARHDPDGWRWKLDPALRMGGFGPWRPEWSLLRMPGVGVPMLGVLALVPEPMGMGSTPQDIQPYLPPRARLVALEDSGHFVHIEHPRRVADLVLEFLS
jgi:pimeloyl-ACP methyl ester carboxylesterase